MQRLVYLLPTIARSLVVSSSPNPLASRSHFSIGVRKCGYPSEQDIVILVGYLTMLVPDIEKATISLRRGLIAIYIHGNKS